MTVLTGDLADLTDADLADMYGTADDDLRDALVAECDRRDRDEAASRRAAAARQRRRDDPVAAEWHGLAYSQYLAAERELKGNLVRRGAPETDGFQLWTGPEHVARRHATEELINWWDANGGRLTVTHYRSQLAAQREAYAHDDRMEPDDAGPVRQPAAASAAVTDAGTRPDGNQRPVRRDRPGDDPVTGACRHPWKQVNLCGNCPRRTAVSPVVAEVRARADAIRVARGASAGTVAVRPEAAVARRQQPVDGAQVLGYVRAFIDRYAVLPGTAAADVLALWVAHCHARDAGGTLLFETTPRLMLLSSEPGSGKSRVLGLARMLCGGRYGLLTEPTAWALAHIVGPSHEAAFVDEGDVLFGRGARKESIRAVLNSGYSRDGVIAHMRGKSVEDLEVFGPVAVAGLDVMRTATGASLEPLFTRSITIRMRKAATAVPPLDRTAREAAALLHTALSAWTAQNRDQLAAQPEMPGWLANRDADVWGPILATAEAAGGDWLDRALTAAAELCGAWEQDGAAEPDVMDNLAGMFATWA